MNVVLNIKGNGACSKNVNAHATSMLVVGVSAQKIKTWDAVTVSRVRSVVGTVLDIIVFSGAKICSIPETRFFGMQCLFLTRRAPARTG